MKKKETLRRERGLCWREEEQHPALNWKDRGRQTESPEHVRKERKKKGTTARKKWMQAEKMEGGGNKKRKKSERTLLRSEQEKHPASRWNNRSRQEGKP